MELVLIRHLATRYNNEKLLQGKLNISVLEPEGEILQLIEQNRRRLLASGGFDRVLVSELVRTLDTATYYRMDSMVHVEALVNELDFGEFEGRSRQEFLTRHGDAWINDPETLVLGESILNLKQRIKAFIDKYQHLDRVLVFGHGAWIRACIAFVRDGHLKSMNKLQVKNNELVILRAGHFERSSIGST